MIKRQILLLIENIPMLKASIGLTHFKCRTKNCRCKKGYPHSANYLSYRKNGETNTVHIPKNLVLEVGSLCQNWKRINRLLEEYTDRKIKELLKLYHKRRRKE